LYLLIVPSLPGGSVFDWVDSLIGPDGLLLVICLLPCLALPCPAPPIYFAVPILVLWVELEKKVK
jgi:hypothetical protein